MATDAQRRKPRDPVCGRQLETTPAGNISAEYRKRRYYFCSERCKHTFHERTRRFELMDRARVGALLTPGHVHWGLA